MFTPFQYSLPMSFKFLLLIFFVFHVSERQDIKREFIAMASTLSKEMEMMEAQLKRWKDTAHDALYLREQALSLRVSLSNKV